MKFIVAQTAGFCFGVKRVVDMALDSTSASEDGISTLGPVIHNAQAVDMLTQRGARVASTPSEVPPNSTVLIRAHGVPPQTQSELDSAGCHVLDGTCPKVKTVHKVIAKFCSQGFDIVITGDEGHAEVVALLGYAEGKGHLIQSLGDIATLPRFEKVCLVSQTTFDRDTFDTIAERFRELYTKENLVIKKTICAATNKRQEETRELAKQVDAMIVVGGKHSANTVRLANIARETGIGVQHVETEKEIEFDRIAHCETVGITAGASTPNWMIKRVTDYVSYLDRAHSGTPLSFVKRFLDLCSTLNIFVASGAAVMYSVSCFLQGKEPTLAGASLSFLYFFSMYLWNSLASIELTQHHGIGRYNIFSAHKKLLLSATGVCVLSMLVIALGRSVTLFYLMLFSTLVGTAYHLTLVPPIFRKILRYGNLKDIPTSRDLFVALAWAVLLTFIPHDFSKPITLTLPILFCFGWIFVLAYLRSIIFDLRDIEGDRIMGRETLVTIVGEKKIRKAILVLLPLSLLGLMVYPIVLIISRHELPDTGKAFVAQIPVLFYIYLFLRQNQKISFRRTTVFNFLADAQFYIAGILAFVASQFLSS